MDREQEIKFATAADGSSGSSIEHFFRLLQSYWWLLLLTTLVAAGASYATSQVVTPIYRSLTTIMIDVNSGKESTGLAELNAGERLARTYAEIIQSGRIIEQVAESLSISEERLGSINADHVAGTQLIRIDVENQDPELAASVANAIVDIFAAETLALQTSGYATSKENLQEQLQYLESQIQTTATSLQDLDTTDLENYQIERSRLEGILAQYNQNYTSLLQSYEQLRLAELESTSNIIQLDPAAVPTAPVRPRPIFNTALGAILGLALGVALILLIDILDNTVRSSGDIQRLTGLPVLASLGIMQKDRHAETSELAAVNNPRGPVAESFRNLRTGVLFSAVDKPNGTIVITSSMPEQGKSWVTANLGTVLAQAGHKVLVVDCDFRRPRQQKIFEIPNRTGLTRLLLNLDPNADEMTIDKTFSEAETPYHASSIDPRLWVMTTGALPPNPSELLGSAKMTQMLEIFSERFDYVLIDSPPAMVVTDPYVLGVRADGVILVASAGDTRRNQLVEVINRFRELRVPVMGIVVNKVSQSSSYYSNYSYGYTYDDTPEKKSKSPLRRWAGRRRLSMRG